MLIDGDADGTGEPHPLQDLIQISLAIPTELSGSLLTTNTSLSQYPASDISAHVNKSYSPPGKFTTNSKSDGTKSTHGPPGKEVGISLGNSEGKTVGDNDATVSTSVTAPTESSYSPFCSASAIRDKA